MAARRQRPGTSPTASRFHWDAKSLVRSLSPTARANQLMKVMSCGYSGAPQWTGHGYCCCCCCFPNTLGPPLGSKTQLAPMSTPFFQPQKKKLVPRCLAVPGAGSQQAGPSCPWPPPLPDSCAVPGAGNGGEQGCSTYGCCPQKPCLLMNTHRQQVRSTTSPSEKHWLPEER